MQPCYDCHGYCCQCHHLHEVVSFDCFGFGRHHVANLEKKVNKILHILVLIQEQSDLFMEKQFNAPFLFLIEYFSDESAEVARHTLVTC